MIFQQSNPFQTPKPKKVQVRTGIGGAIGGAFKDIAKETLQGVTQIPGDLAQTGAESVTTTPVDSKELKEYLYGKSLTPQERAAVAQKQKHEQKEVPDEIERQKTVIRQFIQRRKEMETPSEHEPTVQEILQKEKEEEEKKKILAAEEERKKQPVALPSGVSKKPGLFGMIKRKRADRGGYEMGKGT